MDFILREADVMCVALRPANVGVLTRVQSALKAQGVSAEWTPRERLHCTLLTSDIPDDATAKAILRGLGLPLVFSTEGVRLEAWGDYLVLVLDPRPALPRIQTDIFNRAEALGLQVSSYAPPGVYRPHVTLGTFPRGSLDGLDGFPTDPLWFDEVVVWNGDYRQVDAARLPKEAGDRLFVEVSGMTRRLVARGGPGSGHFGHAGRPGEVGGSQSSDFHSAPGGRRLAGGLREIVTPEGEAAFREKLLDGIKEHGGGKSREPKEPTYFFEAWVSPQGEAFPVGDLGHEDSAYFAIKDALETSGMSAGDALDLRTMESYQMPDANQGIGELFAESLGWVRVSGTGKSNGIAFHASLPPSDEQMGTILKLVSQNLDTVVWAATTDEFVKFDGTWGIDTPRPFSSNVGIESLYTYLSRLKVRSALVVLAFIRRGGPGSGHFGHEGRHGKVGGSAPGDFHSGQTRQAMRLRKHDRTKLQRAVERWGRVKPSLSVTSETEGNYAVATLFAENPTTGELVTVAVATIQPSGLSQLEADLIASGDNALAEMFPDADDFHSGEAADGNDSLKRRIARSLELHNSPEEFLATVEGAAWMDADGHIHKTPAHLEFLIYLESEYDLPDLPMYEDRYRRAMTDMGLIRMYRDETGVGAVFYAAADVTPEQIDTLTVLAGGLRARGEGLGLFSDLPGLGIEAQAARVAEARRVEKELGESDEIVVERGGPGSGYFGHEGRPGKQGGSLPGNVRVERLPGEDIARANPDGSISVDPDKFFGHSPETQAEILAHEQAHFLEAKIPPEVKATLFDDGVVSAYRGKNVNEQLANMIEDGKLPAYLQAYIDQPGDFHSGAGLGGGSIEKDAEGNIVFVGYHTSIEHSEPTEFVFAQRGEGYYIGLDMPFNPGQGTVRRVKVTLPPRAVFDPRDLLSEYGTDVEASRRAWDSLPKGTSRDDFSAHTYFKSLGFRAEVGEIEPGMPQYGRELIVWNKGDVQEREPVEREEAGKLWDKFVRAKESELGVTTYVARSGETRPPKRERKDTSDWRTGKDLPDDIVDRVHLYLSVDLPEQFIVQDVENPTDWKPEISNPLDGDKDRLVRWLGYNIGAYHSPDGWDMREAGERAGVINRIPTPIMRERIEFLDGMGSALERATLGPEMVALSEAVTAAFGGEPLPRWAMVQGDPDETIEVLAKGKTVSGVIGQMTLSDWTALDNDSKRRLLGEFYMEDAGLETGGMVTMLPEVVRVLYYDTQDILQAQGFEKDSKVRLYRGLIETPDILLPAEMDGGWVNVEISNLSPWTFSPGVAAEYATEQVGQGSILAMDVPVSMIFCNWETGPASRRWLSYLLMASREPMKAYLYPVQRARLRHG